ncbi:hypothetical protein BGX26_003347 [Mortierella sp. AD094]|nr:hypothetical protein BGX26_003347 [Mortierella sp. AD094]
MRPLQRNEGNTKARPLLLEYTSESVERMRQEELYRPASRTVQWCIAPLAFLATMASCGFSIPASVLLMQLLQSQNQQTGSTNYGITLIPTFSVGVDIMGVGVVLVSVMGLFGVAKGCRQLMNLYFGLVLIFIGVQVGNAVLGFLSGSNWIQEALEKSWSRAYEADKGLIRDLQNELTGVFLLSILFKHLATLDQTEKTEEKQADEESLYIKSEKQIEDENARVPLLAEEEEGLPHYSASNIYREDGYITESDDDEDGDEEQQLGGRGKYDGGHEYRDLPEYAEDERETQVYVA